MKKVVDYDLLTGNLSDKSGAYLGICANTQLDDLPIPVEPQSYSNERAATVVDLVSRGMSADDIVKLKTAGLI